MKAIMTPQNAVSKLGSYRKRVCEHVYREILAIRLDGKQKRRKSAAAVIVQWPRLRCRPILFEYRGSSRAHVTGSAPTIAAVVQHCFDERFGSRGAHRVRWLRARRTKSVWWKSTLLPPLRRCCNLFRAALRGMQSARP